jgi:hypothetical protein
MTSRRGELGCFGFVRSICGVEEGAFVVGASVILCSDRLGSIWHSPGAVQPLGKGFCLAFS